MPENSEPEKMSSSTESFGDFSRKKTRPKISLLIGGLIILVIAALGIYFLNHKKTNAPVETQKSPEASSSAKLASNFCNQGTEFKSTKQGYQVCYPTGWVVNNSLQPSDLNVGFDPTAVDANNPGTIFVTINNEPEDQSIKDISNSSKKFEYAKTTVDNTKGTQIIYSREAANGLKENAIDTVLVTNARTYTISLNSTATTYDQNKTLYENFLKSWKFIADTPQPPWADSGNILVFLPWVNDQIDNPVEVSGEAIAFEGTVSIRVKDNSNHVLEETTTQTASGFERSPFKASVTFAKPTTKSGTIEVYLVSPKDGSEQDKVSIPVTFK